MKLFGYVLLAALSSSVLSVPALARDAKPRVDTEKYDAIQRVNHRITAAATIEWYSKTCQSNIDQQTITDAQRFLITHPNQARVREIRGYIETGSKQLLDPCIDGLQSAKESVKLFNQSQ